MAQNSSLLPDWFNSPSAPQVIANKNMSADDYANYYNQEQLRQVNASPDDFPNREHSIFILSLLLGNFKEARKHIITPEDNALFATIVTAIDAPPSTTERKPDSTVQIQRVFSPKHGRMVSIFRSIDTSEVFAV